MCHFCFILLSATLYIMQRLCSTIHFTTQTASLHNCR
ncbi:hypothetical protein GLYMA_11G176201v4 [Glycine max]|nr:hypothetical protein GLYMA_11G176201v4 [Glycine max]KAH1159892.1 hypothetical protein GYH30_031585 [Glycine max]